MFWVFSRTSSGAQWLQCQPLVLPSYRGDSIAVFVVGPAGRPTQPRTQHDYHHDTKVKPETATAVIELLMTGGKMPETCWAVNKRQDSKLENCCIWLVIYLNNINVQQGNQDSVFHTATRLRGYGVEDGDTVVGFRAEGPNFSLLQITQTDTGATHSPIRWVLGAFSRG